MSETFNTVSQKHFHKLKMSETEKLNAFFLDKYLGTDWKFSWKVKRDNCGSCYHYQKLITLNPQFVLGSSTEVVFRTVLHEIAHGICGPYEGHSSKWLSTFKKLLTENGFSDNDPLYISAGQFNDEAILKLRFNYSCPKCGYVVYTNRKKSYEPCCLKCKDLVYLVYKRTEY